MMEVFSIEKDEFKISPNIDEGKKKKHFHMIVLIIAMVSFCFVSAAVVNAALTSNTKFDGAEVEVVNNYRPSRNLQNLLFGFRILQQSDVYTVIQEIDHDPDSFTQGLTYADGILYESTGKNGKSTVQRLDPTTGELLQKIDIESKYFAEGMTYYGDDLLIQITWKSQEGFIYNATNLEKIQSFTFETNRNEGWGITYDEQSDLFIVSDGSNILHFWDRETLVESHRVEVKHPDGRLGTNLNELEFWNGYVLSNV